MAEPQNNGTIRADLQIVADMIEPECRLLDIGCGDGALLAYLARNKNVDGRGIELGMAGVNACVSSGLSVIQGDADTDLNDYPNDAFDYVVLSQTLQATRAPREVLANLLRIGRQAIISFPNFGYWRVRLSLLTKGRMPQTDILPDQWYETQNIHFCTIKDFVVLCREMEIEIDQSIVLDNQGRARNLTSPGSSGRVSGNLTGELAIFVLSKH